MPQLTEAGALFLDVEEDRPYAVWRLPFSRGVPR
jgi:hypothetical protein